jgi:hypothetical protein
MRHIQISNHFIGNKTHENVHLDCDSNHWSHQMSRKSKGKLPPFTAIIRHTTKTAAWKALSVGAKATFVALQSLHNDRAQNAVWISARDGVEKFGLGPNKNRVGTWLNELEHYGFTVKIQGHHLGLTGKGKSAHYRLTDRYHAGKPPTYDFQNWGGVLFERKKRKASAAEIARLDALQKPNPVRNLRTVCPETTDIRGSAEMVEIGNKCPEPTDIRNGFGCPEPTDIASSPSTKSDYRPAKLPWSTPVLVEMVYPDDLRRLYAAEMAVAA